MPMTEDSGAAVSGETLVINTRSRNVADAKRIATHALHEANKRELSGDISLVGCFNYAAGQNVELKGFGKFSGKYFVERVTQSINSAGFVTSLSVRRGGSSKASAVKKSAAVVNKKSASKQPATTEPVYWTGDTYGKQNS